MTLGSVPPPPRPRAKAQPWELDARPDAGPRYATADEMRRAADLRAAEGQKKDRKRERQRRQGESIAHIIERAAVAGHRLQDEFLTPRPGKVACRCSCGWESRAVSSKKGCVTIGFAHLTEKAGVSLTEIVRGGP